jgi:hypothetical protein
MTPAIKNLAYHQAYSIVQTLPPQQHPDPRVLLYDRVKVSIRQELLPLPHIPAPAALRFTRRTTKRSNTRDFDDPVDFHMATPLFYVLLSRHSSTDQVSRQLPVDQSANIVTPAEQALKPSIVFGSRLLLSILVGILRGNGAGVALPKIDFCAEPLSHQMVPTAIIEVIDSLMFSIRGLARVPLDSFTTAMFYLTPKSFRAVFRAMLFYAMLTD